MTERIRNMEKLFNKYSTFSLGNRKRTMSERQFNEMYIALTGEPTEVATEYGSAPKHKIAGVDVILLEDLIEYFQRLNTPMGNMFDKKISELTQPPPSGGRKSRRRRRRRYKSRKL